jgi:hypothetical protein
VFNITEIEKIIRLMIAQNDTISDVTMTSGFYLFSYKKYAWVICRNRSKSNKEFTYRLIYYPYYSNVKDLSLAIDKAGKVNMGNLNHVLFKSPDSCSDKLYTLYKKLYDVIESKLYGIDRVLEDMHENK